MSQSRKVETYYDFLSEHYDAATGGKFEWTPPREAKSILLPRLKKNDDVLDVGVGTGQSAEFLINHGCKVCGLDISEKMLKAARDKFPQLEVHKADLNSGLEILNGRSFDAILAIGVFEFVTNLKLTLSHLMPLLKNSGFFCFTFEELVPGHELQDQRRSFSGPGEIRPGISTEFFHHRYLREEIEEILNLLNLKIIESKQFNAYFKTANMIPIQYSLLLCQKSK